MNGDRANCEFMGMIV